MLQRLLRELAKQQTAGEFTFSIVVTNNDAAQSARPIVENFWKNFPPPASIPVVYAVQPERNIALARNTALDNAQGDFIAFIDDDEFPEAGWLLNLFRVCQSNRVAGVLGPVKPFFERQPPSWLLKAGFYQRPTHPTGHLVPWQECRTGNVLFRRNILDPYEPAFRREFGTGGEDQDFFRRMIEKGHRFIWCDEAVAFEEVPPARWTRRFMINRALLRGKNTLRHRQKRARNLLKSAVAVPAYACALPFLLVAGHHHFMRYVVKLADHFGRLLAFARLNPVSHRRS